MGSSDTEMNRYKEIIIVYLVSLVKGEELPCLDDGSGVGVSIENGRQSSSWEECQRICNELTACSAWTFHEISPFSCDFFSKLESINAMNFSVTGQMNCQDSSSVMVNEIINERNFNNGDDNCIMKGTKIKGVKLKKKRKDSFEECHNACNKNDLCVGWCFKKDEKKKRNCNLFSKLFLKSESKKQQFVSGTKNCSVAQTNGTLQGSIRSSFLTSPNYPNNYQNNLNIGWNVWISNGNAMEVLGFNFGTFELEYFWDWVEVTDEWTGRVLFHSGIAASEQHRTFVSDSSMVHIQFKTDYSITRKGFKLDIWKRQKTIPFECPDVNYNTESEGDPQKRVGAQWASGIRSWEACSNLCQERSDCKYWTWHHSNSGSLANQCVTMQDAGKRVYDTNTISGQRSCRKECNCGIPNRATRIVGGQETEVNESPWRVLVLTTKNSVEYQCGGTIISHQHILTAAHCVEGGTTSNIRVVLGEHDTTDSVEDSRTISAVTNHPSYSHVHTFPYDFSILTLSSPIIFSRTMAPICLPWETASISSLYTGQLATAIGWGRTSSGGPTSGKLMEVDITVQSNAQCNIGWGGVLRDYHICAADSGKGQCNGDSGGPLFLTENGRSTQIGVLSFKSAENPCGAINVPGVSARVTEVKDWIKETASGT